MSGTVGELLEGLDLVSRVEAAARILGDASDGSLDEASARDLRAVALRLLRSAADEVASQVPAATHARGPDRVREVWRSTGSATVSGAGDDLRIFSAVGNVYGRRLVRAARTSAEASERWRRACALALDRPSLMDNPRWAEPAFTPDGTDEPTEGA